MEQSRKLMITSAVFHVEQLRLPLSEVGMFHVELTGLAYFTNWPNT